MLSSDLWKSKSSALVGMDKSAVQTRVGVSHNPSGIGLIQYLFPAVALVGDFAGRNRLNNPIRTDINVRPPGKTFAVNKRLPRSSAHL